MDNDKPTTPGTYAESGTKATKDTHPGGRFYCPSGDPFNANERIQRLKQAPTKGRGVPLNGLSSL